VKNTDIICVFLHQETWKTRGKSGRLHKRTRNMHKRAYYT